MPIASLDKIIDKTYPSLSPQSRQAIYLLCEEEQLEAGVSFIREGRKNNFEYFVIEGVVRSYLMNQEGELVTLSFFEELCILSPHVTRTRNHRSQISFEAVTACTLVRFDAPAFETLMEQNLEIRAFGNTVLQQELFTKVNKEIRLISWTAKERLLQFRKDYHMLENRVPHTMIASYLGITNISLSRLRKELKE